MQLKEKSAVFFADRLALFMVVRRFVGTALFDNQHRDANTTTIRQHCWQDIAPNFMALCLIGTLVAPTAASDQALCRSDLYSAHPAPHPFGANVQLRCQVAIAPAGAYSSTAPGAAPWAASRPERSLLQPRCLEARTLRAGHHPAEPSPTALGWPCFQECFPHDCANNLFAGGSKYGNGQTRPGADIQSSYSHPKLRASASVFFTLT